MMNRRPNIDGGT